MIWLQQNLGQRFSSSKMHLSSPVANTAVHSKVVVLLLLICCLVYFPLVVWVLCLSLFCCANHLEEEGRAGCLAFIDLRVSCCCKCCVTLPHGVVGWSAVYNCGIS